MAVFSAPKVWTTEVLEPTDLNALVSAIATSLNSISDDQVASDAAIAGSKLASAPLGIPSGKIQDGAVTQSKLAVGSSSVGVDSEESGTETEKTANPGPTSVATITRTVAGGSVVLLGTCTIEFTHGDSNAATVALRLKRGVTAITTDLVVTAKAVIPYVTPAPMSIFFVDTGQSGSTTWTLEVQRMSGVAGITIRDWQLFAWELK
jgi:hypothetical protein